MLNIALVTTRKNPRFPWFVQSLWNQWQQNQPAIKLIIVDFHADDHGRREEFAGIAAPFIAKGIEFKHVPPMPNVFQGPHRLTTQDYFAAANARNTGICLADDGYIAFVDDLSVLMPGWLDQVLEAQRLGWIACGAYKKVKELRVTEGYPEHYVEFESGIDHRLKVTLGDAPVKCVGGWFFGYTATPVEAFLSINGYNSECDSTGYEDVVAGMMLEGQGYGLRYCRRMLALESEEAHGEGPTFRRWDKGVSPKDSSHAMIFKTMKGNFVSPNPYNMRELRKKVLAGEPFPIQTEPTKHWFDGQEVRTM